MTNPQHSDGPDDLRGDALLVALARAAGLRPEWKDYRGERQTVSSDTLRALLASFDLPAGDDRQARDSLDRVRSERERQVPKLLVGRVGQPLTLPPALAARVAGEIELRYEDGESTRLHCSHASDGQARISGVYRPGYHCLHGDGVALPIAIAPAHRPEELALHPRRWGLAAQLYSLRRPDDLGMGDFSALALLARRTGQRGAQALAISPVHALFSADVNHSSPYSPSSRLLLNALYIDPARFTGEDWLQQRVDALGAGAELQRLREAELVDWPAAATLKLRLLREAWRDFERIDTDRSRRSHFDAFRSERGEALEDHARFEAIHARQFGDDPGRWHWRSWPAELRDPRSGAVAEFARANADEVSFHAFLQWLADDGLAHAQAQARAGGMDVGLIADLAVGTDSGGSHAWSRQHDMLRGASIGAPPDELNTRGQDWGLTTFSPRALLQHGHAPFIEMLRAALRHAGGVRIDHILGLNRLWLVPHGAGPREGAYVDYPLHDLINLISLEAHRHHATVVGEDLGTVPEGFRDELAGAGLLGMRVLYFERDHGYYVEPSRWSDTALAMTTTHDLPTIAGWWRGRDIEWQQQLDLLPPGSSVEHEQQQREQNRQALWGAFRHAGVADGDGTPPPPGQPGPVVDAALEFVARTPSPLALVPLEDLLGQVEQPNLPGTRDEHPNWRRRLPEPADRLFERGDVAARLDRLQAQRPGR